MFLNDRQMTVAVERTARALMPIFDSLSTYDRYVVTNEIATAALPIIKELPEDATSDNIVDYLDLIREHSKFIIVAKIRNNGGLEEATDEEILDHVDGEVIVMFSQAVQQMVATALDSIPTIDNSEMEKLVSTLDDVDWDEEFKKLVQDNE